MLELLNRQTRRDSKFSLSTEDQFFDCCQRAREPKFGMVRSIYNKAFGRD